MLSFVSFGVGSTSRTVRQPKDGDLSAAYAVCEGVQGTLRRTVYPLQSTIQSYTSRLLHASDIHRLAAVLRTGGQLPSSFRRVKNSYENRIYSWRGGF
jgi:hypothetical protein